MAAEGGTEYGHMITYAVSDDIWGEYVTGDNNPILTNRNKAPYIIQGIGHGDLIQDKNGDWHILSLGFRQMAIWMPFHSLGREVFLSPAHFDENGRLFAGLDGTTDAQYEIKGDFVQNELPVFTFGNTDPSVDWCYLRKYHPENYKLSADKYELCGTDLTLDDADSPTFIAMRQRDFDMELCVNVNLCGNGEGGVTMYMCENEHYDIALKKTADGTFAILKLNIGNPAPFGFRTPDEVVYDMAHQLTDTEGYSPSKGLFSARKAIMQYAQLKNIPNVTIDDIYTGNGVSELINLSLSALLDNGD